MVVGFDAYHSKNMNGDSFGALVASLNDSLTSYYSIVEKHHSKQEISNHIPAMFEKALQAYKKKNADIFLVKSTYL